MQHNISIEIEEFEESEPIFTRYLYVLEDVEYSLYRACIDQKTEEAYFWAYELYYSGFPQMVFSVILQIIKESKNMDQNIQKRIRLLLNDEVNRKDEDIATMIFNMIRYQKKSLCVQTNEKKKRRLFVFIHSNTIKLYQTHPPLSQNEKAWKVLPQVCFYTSIKKSTENKESIQEKWYYNWLYYASFSPIWHQRISKWGGQKMEQDRKIVFPNDDVEDDFYKNYGYEPDEQPRGVQLKCISL
jgi:hypothetical protein